MGCQSLPGLPRSIKFAVTHLYTWVERGTVRVKCLAQEHNTMSPARTRTRTTRSGVEHTNHEATAPSAMAMYMWYIYDSSDDDDDDRLGNHDVRLLIRPWRPFTGVCMTTYMWQMNSCNYCIDKLNSLWWTVSLHHILVTWFFCRIWRSLVGQTKWDRNAAYASALSNQEWDLCSSFLSFLFFKWFIYACIHCDLYWGFPNTCTVHVHINSILYCCWVSCRERLVNVTSIRHCKRMSLTGMSRNAHN